MINAQQKHILPFAIGRAMQSAILLTATFLVSGFFVLFPASIYAASPGEVIINEFVSNPSSGNEWVELLNTTDADISLSGWKLTELATPGATPTEVDWIELSGTIPPYGVLVFEVSGANFNNTGDSIGLYDDTANLMQRVTYGSVNGYISDNGLVTEPASGQSGSFDGTNWSISSAPTKGWFNDAGQGGAVAPLLSAIDASLSGAGITSNIGELDNPSATPIAESDALYFEKTGKGKIVFTNSLNLSDQATVAVLQGLGSAMEMSDGHVKFDSATADAMNATGAKIYMYGLDALGFTTQPNIIVKDDAGTVIDGVDIVSVVSYTAGGANNGEIVFEAAHFTQFDADLPIVNETTGEKYATIQSAIVAASSGDTINVAAGTYEEDLEIPEGTDNLELAGAGYATTVIKGVATTGAPNIKIHAVDGVKIHGFTIESPDVPDGAGSGGITMSGQNIEIYDNKFISNFGAADTYAIAIQTYRSQWIPEWDPPLWKEHDISGLSIHDNIFADNGQSSNNGYYGVYINRDSGSGTATIEDNSFSGTVRWGVITERSNVIIKNNDITPTVGVRAGIGALDFGDASGHDPEDYNGEPRPQSNIQITGNTISGFSNADWGAISLGYVITDGQELSDIAITDNSIEDNAVGILTASSADEILITANTIQNNTVGIQNDDTASLDVENNFWGAASGPAGSGSGAGDSVSANVDYRPWLLEEGGDTYDQTIALTAAGEWILVSAPQLLSAAPSIVDDQGGAIALLGYEDGAFVSTPSDSEKPVSAFYIKTMNKGGIGFNYAEVVPYIIEKDLSTGWNLVGAGDNNSAINAFSTIAKTNDADGTKGVTTLNVPTLYNTRKDIAGSWGGSTGNIDITNWDSNVLNRYDGYWVYSNAPKTYSIIPSEESTDTDTVASIDGLTVSLASDTPGASTVIANSTNSGNDGAQAFVPFIKIALTAGSDAVVNVTDLQFKRTGISSDSDISSIYLYEGSELGSNILAVGASFSGGVVSFNDSTGLITIPAGQTKYVMLRGDIADDVASGKTIKFSLESASSITTDGAAISGSFPLTGNTMSTANVSDIGSITIANVSPSGAATVGVGTTNYELWRFSLAASNQDMELRYLKISMTGSAGASDINNFKLQVAGTDIATVSSMNSNDEIVFDLSENPYLISVGQIKNMSLYGDVVSGTSNTIHFQIQEMYHANVYDTEYGVYIKLNQADSWTIVESNSSSTNTTITPGTLTISKSTDSPTGNVFAGATNVPLARFDFTATGEDIRVTSLNISSTTAVNDGKVYFDGSQVGSTTDLNTSVAFAFGTSMVIPAGETKVVEIRADVEDQNGADLSVGTTVQINLTAGASNARALASSTSLSTSSVTGNTVTVQTGTLTATENTSVLDATNSTPSGVKGEANVLIGSFILTSGSGEGVTISQITMKDDVGSATGTSLAEVFQNLRLESGGPADANGNYAAGTGIGVTVGTLTDTEDTTYNFNSSPNIKLAAAQQMVVNVYADVMNSATTTNIDGVNADTTGVIYPSVVTATGNDTSSDTSDSNGTNAGLQNVYIATSGSLIVENVASGSQAKSRIVTAGSTDVEVYKFKLTALTENIEVTRFIISDAIASSAYGATTVSGKPTSTLYNFKLYDGSTQVGSTVVALSGTTTSTPTNGGYVDFNLGTANPYTVSAGQEKTLTLKASVKAWPSLSSGSTHTFSLQGLNTGSTSGPLEDGATYAVTARGLGSSTVVSGPAADATGQVVTARRAYPLVEKLALPTGTLSSSGDHTIAKFKVTAVGGQVRLKKIAFDIAWTDTTTTTLMKIENFKLYRNGSVLSNSVTSGTGEFVIYDGLGTAATNRLSGGTDGYLSLDSTFSPLTGTSTSTRAVLLFGADADYDAVTDTGEGEEVISSSSTNIYEIKANVTNAHQGTSTDADSITVTLLGDDSASVLTDNLVQAGSPTNYRFGVVTLGASPSTTDYNFIWSDYSEDTGTHTHTVPSTGKSWTHGFQVPSTSGATSFIPLDNWSLTK